MYVEIYVYIYMHTQNKVDHTNPFFSFVCCHVILQKKTYQCIKCQMVFYSEWDIQVHVANHMLGRKYFFIFLITGGHVCSNRSKNFILINSETPLCVISVRQEMFHLTTATII